MKIIVKSINVGVKIKKPTHATKSECDASFLYEPMAIPEWMIASTDKSGVFDMLFSR